MWIDRYITLFLSQGGRSQSLCGSLRGTRGRAT